MFPPRCRVCVSENVTPSKAATFVNNFIQQKKHIFGGGSQPSLTWRNRKKIHYRIKWQLRWHSLRIHDLRARGACYSGGFWHPGHMDYFLEVLWLTEIPSGGYRASGSLGTESTGPKVQMRMKFAHWDLVKKMGIRAESRGVAGGFKMAINNYNWPSQAAGSQELFEGPWVEGHMSDSTNSLQIRIIWLTPRLTIL